MAFYFQNNVKTTLAADVLVGATSISVSAASSPWNTPGSPGTDTGVLVLMDNLYAPTKIEIITYTGRSGAGPYTLTGVSKGQEGTADQAWTSGAYVIAPATAAELSDSMQGSNNLSEITNAATARANIGAGNIEVIATGSDSSMSNGEVMTLTHTAVAESDILKRFVKVFERTAGTSTTDNTLDFDSADYSKFTMENQAYNTSITPSATTNTYSNIALCSSGASAANVGRVDSTYYDAQGVVFQGPGKLSGFSLVLGANSNTPTGDIGYNIYRLHLAIGGGTATFHHALPSAQATLITSGQFTPTASATNTVTLGSAIPLDQGFYAITFFSKSAQDGNADYYVLQSGTPTTRLVMHGLMSKYYKYPTAQDSDAMDFTCAPSSSLNITLTNGTLNAPLTLTLGSGVWSAADVGKSIVGNSGYCAITGFSQQAVGGTAATSAGGTAANAFDSTWNTACTQTSTNGNISYDLGAGNNKSFAVAGIRSNRSSAYTLVIEASNDNFSSVLATTTLGTKFFHEGATYWFDLTTANARYWRIRETGGNTLDIIEIIFNTATAATAGYQTSNFADTSTIASGSWSMYPAVFANGVAAQNAYGTAVALTDSQSQVSTAGWETMGAMGTNTISEQFSVFDEDTIPNVLTGNGNNAIRGVELSPGKFVVITINESDSGTSNYLYQAVVVDVDQTTGAITVGTPTTIRNGTSSIYISHAITALDSVTAVLSYCDGTAFSYVQALVVSGSTISLGTAINATSNTNFGLSTANICKLSSSKFLCAGQIATTGYLTGVVGTVTGTSISLGSTASIDSTGSSSASNYTVGTLGTDKALAVYQLASSATTNKARVISVSGSTITSNAVVNDTSANTPYLSNAVALAADTVIFEENQYSTTINAPKQGLQVITVSGTTPTFGTKVNEVLSSTNSSTNRQRLFAASEKDVFYHNFNPYMILRAGVSGSTVTLGRPVETFSGTATTTTFLIGGKGNSNNTPGAFAIVLTDNEGGASGNYGTPVYSVPISTAGYLCTSPCLAVSLNGRSTFSIWTGTAARAIASSLNSVHGGTEGVWYYRNNASTWAAASTSNAQTAIRQASAFPNNLCPIRAWEAMTQANWTTFGFAKSATGTLDVATVMIGAGSMARNTGVGQNAAGLLSFGYTARDTWSQTNTGYTINCGSPASITVTNATGGTKDVSVVAYGEA
jgi:hypothetical protein